MGPKLFGSPLFLGRSEKGDFESQGPFCPLQGRSRAYLSTNYRSWKVYLRNNFLSFIIAHVYTLIISSISPISPSFLNVHAHTRNHYRLKTYAPRGGHRAAIEWKKWRHHQERERERREGENVSENCFPLASLRERPRQFSLGRRRRKRHSEYFSSQLSRGKYLRG